MPDPRVEEIRQDLAELRRDFEQRFSDLDQSQNETHGKLDLLNGAVAKVKAELGPGLPDPEERGNRPTIRDRLHAVEHDREVIEGLASALTEQLKGVTGVVRDLQTESEKARLEREAAELIRQKQAKRWSQRKVVFVTTCTGVGAICAIMAATFGFLRLLGVGG